MHASTRAPGATTSSAPTRSSAGVRAQRTAKAAQLRAILRYIEGPSDISRTEPVIVGGDFNILRHEFESLLSDDTLGALAPVFRGLPLHPRIAQRLGAARQRLCRLRPRQEGFSATPLQQQLPHDLPHALRLRGPCAVHGREGRGLLRPLRPLRGLGLVRLPRRHPARRPTAPCSANSRRARSKGLYGGGPLPYSAASRRRSCCIQRGLLVACSRTNCWVGIRASAQ